MSNSQASERQGDEGLSPQAGCTTLVLLLFIMALLVLIITVMLHQSFATALCLSTLGCLIILVVSIVIGVIYEESG